MTHHNVLVMSGGGARGAVEAGMLDWLVCKEGRNFDVITGVSAGALNAAVLAQAKRQAQVAAVLNLLRAYEQVDGPEDVYQRRPLSSLFHKLGLWRWTDGVSLIRNPSLYETGPLLDLIHRWANPAKVPTDRPIGRSRLPHEDDGTWPKDTPDVAIGVTQLESGRYMSVRLAPQDPPEVVLASASIPGVFPPVKIGGRHYVDGGVRNMAPLADAFDILRERWREGDTATFYILLATPLLPQREEDVPWNALGIGQRTLGMMMNEVYRNDIDRAIQTNDSHVQPYRQSDYKTIIRPTFRIFEPERKHLGALEFEPDAIQRGIQAGREIARRKIEEGGMA